MLLRGRVWAVPSQPNSALSFDFLLEVRKVFTSFGGSQCLFGSWRLISVRVLIARNDGRSLASHGASRVLQIFKAPACDFRAPGYKKCAECEAATYRVVSGQQCEAAMALASDIVLVTLLCMVRDGAPARFPVSKLAARAGGAFISYLLIYYTTLHLLFVHFT